VGWEVVVIGLLAGVVAGLVVGREAPAADREQAQTTFVLAEHAHRAVMYWREDTLELL
jgi:uncharacterized membrane-anchored protein YhcB (DUF1043 family)